MAGHLTHWIVDCYCAKPQALILGGEFRRVMPDEFDEDLVAPRDELGDGVVLASMHPCDYHEHDGVEGSSVKKAVKKTVSWASIM